MKDMQREKDNKERRAFRCLPLIIDRSDCKSRCVFHEDNVSPFLFILAIIHPTMVLRKMKATYEFRSEDHL